MATVYPEGAEQRCWNPKLRNAPDAVPKKHQPEVKAALQTIARADSSGIGRG